MSAVATKLLDYEETSGCDTLCYFCWQCGTLSTIMSTTIPFKSVENDYFFPNPMNMNSDHVEVVCSEQDEVLLL